MKNILFLSVFLFVAAAFAMDEGAVNFEALTKTQNLLKDQKAREAQALDTDKAKAADSAAGVATLGDGAAKNEIYNIASDIMPWLVEQTQGDPMKMADLLLEAQKNPQAFLSKLPESEKKKIRNLSNYVDQKKSTRSPASSAP